MEINLKTNEYDGLDIKGLTNLYVRNGIVAGHFKHYFDSRRSTLSVLSIKTLIGQFAKLESTEAILPNEEQSRILRLTFSHLAANVVGQMSDAKTSISTENVISTALMANQTGKMFVTFQGGITPTYTLFEREEDNEGNSPVLGHIKVVAGTPVYNQQIANAYKRLLNFKTVPVAASVVVNLAVTVASTMKFNTEKMCYPRITVPTKQRVIGFDKGILVTGLANVASQKLTHQPAGISTIIADIAKNSPKILKLLESYPVGKLGKTVNEIRPVPFLGGKTFAEHSIKILKQFHTEGSNQLSKAKEYIKDFDTGFKSVNAALKWRAALDIVFGDNSEPGHHWPTIAYYGAGGARARRVFENRAHVHAYDIAISPRETKKVSIDDFKKWKIDTWTTRDIFQHHDFVEETFVSDIFMESWKQDIDRNGHKFVSGVLKGQIVNDSLVTCAKLPPTRLIKGFLPDEDEMLLYADCFPFVAMRICRPLTHEIIYAKHDIVEGASFEWLDAEKNVIPFKRIIKAHTDWFAADAPSPSIHRRVAWISGPDVFKEFIKDCWVALCDELSFQQRRFALDPRNIASSPHNRDWGLGQDDLPCLFVPKHMRANAINAMDNNSSFFGLNCENEVYGDDDLMDYMDTMGAVDPGEMELDDTGGTDSIIADLSAIDLDEF